MRVEFPIGTLMDSIGMDRCQSCHGWSPWFPGCCTSPV